MCESVSLVFKYWLRRLATNPVLKYLINWEESSTINYLTECTFLNNTVLLWSLSRPFRVIVIMACWWDLTKKNDSWALILPHSYFLRSLLNLWLVSFFNVLYIKCFAPSLWCGKTAWSSNCYNDAYLCWIIFCWLCLLSLCCPCCRCTCRSSPSLAEYCWPQWLSCRSTFQD